MAYILPDKSLLTKSSDYDETEQQEIARREADLITDCLDSLGMRIEVDTIDIAPQSIRFNCIAAERVQIRLLPRLSAEIQYTLGSESVRILAPIPGAKYIGIEVNNPFRRTIYTGDVIDYAKSPLTFPLGIDTNNNIISCNIANQPHMLIGGVTGAGKSVCLQSMICSLLMSTTPDELLFMMVDTKACELTIYEDIPNLLTPVVTDPYDAITNFHALVNMMEKRYSLAQEYGAKSLVELNDKLPKKLPYILVVVDEIADLMFLSKHEVEESITRIAGKARAVGIHLALATQSPRREVVSGLLRANLPSKIGFTTSSALDSRIILGQNGCEKLTNNGDCLFSNQGRAPIRIQSPFIDSEEINSIVDHCRSQVITDKVAA